MNRVLLLIVTGGCADSRPDKDRLEPTFMEVSGAIEGLDAPTSEGADTGTDSETDPTASSLPFSNTTREITVNGQALNREAEPYAYNGTVEVTIRPGVIKAVEGATKVTDTWGMDHWYIQATEGVVSTRVSFASAFGNTRVWLTATADPTTPDEPSSQATGVTERFAIALPTIPELQDVSALEVEDPFTTSPLFGEFVTVRTEDRQVVVTSLTTKGFWASDLGPIDETPATVGGDYRGLFVYTFNKPEGVSVGDRLGLLGGGVQEYVGATQLSFPLYEPMEGETLPVPDAAVLPLEGEGDTVCDGTQPNNMFMEPFESSLVTISAGTIPANFKEMPPGTDADPDFADFEQYFQWPLELPGGCRVMVVSNTTVPGFDPIAHAGETLSSVTGLLSYVRAGGHRWILLTRDADDLPFFEDGDTAGDAERPAGASWPLPLRGHAPAHQCEHDHVGDHLRPTKD
jgi:hypothetical protein